MKKLFAVISLCILTSCVAPAFEGVEYQNLLALKVNSELLMPKCGTLSQPDVQNKLVFPAKMAFEAARYRTNAKDIFESNAELLKMIAAFEKTYENGKQPSNVYCVEKLKNIYSGVDKIIHSYATL